MRRPPQKPALHPRHRCTVRQLQQVDLAPPADPGALRVAGAHHKPPRDKRRRPQAGSRCGPRQSSGERLLRGSHLSHATCFKV
ncbi:hypothetical protein NDU88_006315 [Pleurodeles waltl]|uniref:Uncharacterized protein n=1 Tax=Pleurodeles waltl TaxID=8319 RepID=A0AAV7ULK6_PLEWA|nr:hypothetical protein NDU88_006315 [Pleurodeles waltl]